VVTVEALVVMVVIPQKIQDLNIADLVLDLKIIEDITIKAVMMTLERPEHGELKKLKNPQSLENLKEIIREIM